MQIDKYKKQIILTLSGSPGWIERIATVFYNLTQFIGQTYCTTPGEHFTDRNTLSTRFVITSTCHNTISPRRAKISPSHIPIFPGHAKISTSSNTISEGHVTISINRISISTSHWKISTYGISIFAYCITTATCRYLFP